MVTGRKKGVKPAWRTSAAFSELGQRTVPPPISWLMRLTLDHPRLISLAAGFTDNESLPIAEARLVLEQILSDNKSGRAALQYGSTAGDDELRKMTMDRLRAQDRPSSSSGEAYDPERTLITHGSQQLLYLTTECLCDPGDLVLVEDPTYFVYLSILQSHGVRCRGIPLDEDGLDLRFLEQLLEELKRKGELQRVKLLYLVSYFQNPSGVTTRWEKKAAVLELLRHYEKAAGHPVYLLEDAAYRELRFAGPDTASALSAPRASSRVIYAGTYSKPFATGVRVGYGKFPAPLFERVCRVKGNHDFGTSHLLQQLVRRALLSGKYEQHLPVLQKRYSRKAGIMMEGLKRQFPLNARWLAPSGGLYIWVELPKQVRSGPKSHLFKKALERDVLYVPGELCYADDPTRQAKKSEMRLSFGGATESDIREGIARLGKVLTEF